MAIVKDAEYYRQYRAKRKEKQMASMHSKSLFATTEKDDLQPQPAAVQPKVQPDNTMQPSELEMMQPQPAAEKEIAAEMQRLQNRMDEFHMVAKLIEEKMGKIIEFPGLKDFLKWEKEVIATEQEEEARLIAENIQLRKELDRATEEATATNEKLKSLCNQFEAFKENATMQLQQMEGATNETKMVQPFATKFTLPKVSLRTLIQCCLLLVFIGANTIFLVSEQHNLYKTFGYDTPTSVAIAVLTELAVVLLSYFACNTKNKTWKIGLYATLAFSVIVLHGLVTTGAKDKGSVQISNQEEVVSLKKRIATFEQLEEQALARISNIDKVKYPTLIASLTAKLNKSGPEGYSHKISQLRSELRNIGNTSGAQLISDKTNILVKQREMALLLNLVFAHLLGFLIGNPRKD